MFNFRHIYVVKLSRRARHRMRTATGVCHGRQEFPNGQQHCSSIGTFAESGRIGTQVSFKAHLPGLGWC